MFLGRLGLRISGGRLPVAVLLMLALCAAAQDPAHDSSLMKSPEAIHPLQSGAQGAGANHRLILKDGNYQLVRKYEIVGERVRYISVERGGDWEEMPVDLVDWDATKKWEREHQGEQQAAPAGGAEASPAMKEAAEIDKEEADEREELKSRMPEVAKGLELPDEDSVFALDNYAGKPELVELAPNELAVDARTHKGLSTFHPLAGQRANIELPGAHAKAHLHVHAPVIYVSLNVTDDAELVTTHALTVDTHGAKGEQNGKHGAHSAQSGFAIVRVDERNAVRIVGAIHVSLRGVVTQSEDVIPAAVEVLPGKHWMKITPAAPLETGEYALVEILSPEDVNQAVWDFRVDPQAGENAGSLGPIFKR